MSRWSITVCVFAAFCGCGQSSTPPGKTGSTNASNARTGDSEKAADSQKTPDPTLSAPGTDQDSDAVASRDDGSASETPKASGDSDPSTAASSEEVELESVASILRKLRQAKSEAEAQPLLKNLEAAVENEPDNITGLVTMARIMHLNAQQPDDAESAAAATHKTVVYLRRALEVDSGMIHVQDFQKFIYTAFIDEASLLAKEQKLPESLGALKELIDYGFLQTEGFDEINALAEVRALPEYAELVDETREKLKAAILMEVAEAFESTVPFDFDFDLEDVTGKKVSKKDLAGKVLIVDFWGTWCPPCRKEIPHLVELQETFGDKGLQIIGLSEEREPTTEENAALVRDFCEQHGVNYPCALLTEEVLNQVPELEGFPTTLFIDRTGKVRMMVAGYRDKEFLTLAVERLLSERPAEAATDASDTAKDAADGN
ncbi:MAG: TlpA family protein disulfide reductase [Planctomycetales bacterium]